MNHRRPDADARVRLGAGSVDVEPDLVVRAGDVFSLLASPGRHRVLRERFAVTEDVIDEDLLPDAVEVDEIVITKREYAGKPLESIGVDERFGCYLISLRRSSSDTPSGDSACA